MRILVDAILSKKCRFNKKIEIGGNFETFAVSLRLFSYDGIDLDNLKKRHYWFLAIVHEKNIFIAPIFFKSQIDYVD